MVLVFYNANADDILPPNKILGRTSSVFAQKVLVRIKPGYDIFSKDDLLIKKSEIKVDFILHPNSTLTYNTKLRNSANPSFQMSKLYDAEDKLLRTFVLYYDGLKEPEAYCKHIILTNPAIELAEPYYVPEFQSYVPNDPLISSQDANLRLINAYEAWEIEKGNPNVIIGISDSGTNQGHEDLSGNLGINEGEIPNDGIDNDNNGYVDDYNGYDFSWESTGSAYPGNTYNPSDMHGQQVSGISGASTNNGIGIAGIGFNSKIFPLKIVEGNQLKYAYESIIYAAVRGFKVINCSWGVVKPYSDIDQSIINYAISRDVSIVAAAGNVSSKFTKYDVFFPAGYYGVIGVGEVNSNDRLTSSSSISSACRILAPGEGNFTTTNNGYFTCDGGTSFAAPVVAGAVALARSKYPQLNAIQAIEFVRQSVDRHQNFSTNDRALIPGRINLLKAVSVNPFSIPSILPEAYLYRDQTGEITDRFTAGDLVDLIIKTKNHLGEARNLTFTLSKAYDPAQSVTIVDSIITIDYFAAGEELDLSNFKMRITQNFSGNVILRVDIKGDNGYSDFFKFNFVPSRDISSFSNNEIKFSMSDIGEFGYSTSSDSVQGLGFAYRAFGNQIYRNSSVMLSHDSKIVYNSSINKVYGFQSVKGFIPPNRFSAIYNDNRAGLNLIGFEIKQDIEFPSPESKAVRMEFELKNISGQLLKDVALGLFIDWDIGPDAENNRTKVLTSVIPDEIPLNSAAAQIAYVNNTYPYFGSGVYSHNDNVEAQSAGIDFTVVGGFDNNRRLQSLKSGQSLQTNNVGDIGTVTGIKFSGNWQANESKMCVICVGAGDSEDDLSEELKNCLFGTTSVKEDNSFNHQVVLYPHPANDVLFLNFEYSLQNVSFQIFNILGIACSDKLDYDILADGEQIGFDISNLNNGVYLLNYTINGVSKFKRFIIAR